MNSQKYLVLGMLTLMAFAAFVIVIRLDSQGLGATSTGLASLQLDSGAVQYTAQVSQEKLFSAQAQEILFSSENSSEQVECSLSCKKTK